MTERSHVTSHVLDSTTGRPAGGVELVLESRTDGAWMPVASAITDADGRATALGPVALPAGLYRVTFDTGAYFGTQHRETMYPEVTISFELANPGEHYHIPLLLSPFAYSTYRGS
ncbi:hydroxyisourate hydrolase [Subtercola sp. PAMC28395]|uniref:hydroxyisourate hydrolase n=1 Tax=Subtercola sp. PAMC28395 TaxID=2846775 RepID=UPI001C0D1DB9|nr:hydroxyisourate hydrolase [Subtercola sp. PAMC28395]QWT22795.1 hydroxyisourate hydrolase [Subtercola sp. PAMC28395]